VAPLTVETQGNLYFLTVDLAGLPADGTAMVRVRWSQLAVHKLPDSCELVDVGTATEAILCPVTADSPQVTGIEFNGKALDLLPRILVEAAPSNFGDPEPANNVQEWARLVGLLGLLI
jgi:hypothetical protein